MTTDKALIPYEPNTNLGELMRVGAQLARSGFFADAKAESQAVAKVLAGAELGIPPVAALMGIHFFNNKLSLSANLIAGLIKRQRPRYDYRVRQWQDELCELAFFRDGQEEGVSAFSRKDAEQAGLWGKNTWATYPRNLLFARALTNGARLYFPDIFLGGVYTPEEMGAEVDAAGEPIDQAAAPPPTRASIDDLYPPTAPMPESLAIPRRDLADAERAFWDAAKRGDHTTPRKVRQALGLPDASGALEAWVDKHGWDAARKLLEDGKTVAEFGKAPPNGSPILRRDQGQELERLRDETGIDPEIVAATDFNKRASDLSESEAQAVIESLKQALAVEA